MRAIIATHEVSHPRYTHRVTWSEAGKREQAYFPTLAAAKNFVAEKKTKLLNDGRRHSEITDPERRAVLAARDAFKPFVEQGLEPSLQDAVEHYVAHLSARHRSCAVSQAVTDYTAKLKAEGKSSLYTATVGYRLAAFVKVHGAALVATINRPEIDAYLQRLTTLPAKGTKKTGAKKGEHGNPRPIASPRTTINHRVILSGFFNWCVAAGFTTSNPVEKAFRPKTIKGAVGILTPGEAANLLGNAASDIVAPLALSLFAGVRHEELRRLDWRDIDLVGGFVKIESDKSKSGARRLVPIRPNLAAWLAPVAKLAGRVMPSPMTWRLRLDDAFEAAKITRTRPHNFGRHSFASYHLSKFKDAAALALEMGHAETGIVFAHYREVVKPAAANDYWSIAPDKKGNVINLPAAAAQKAS